MAPAIEFAGVNKWFGAHHVQLPLRKGDLLFFNPALMHGAGANRTADRFRMANLLQVSSAFGRAMEAVDRTAMTLALYPALARLRRTPGVSLKRFDRNTGFARAANEGCRLAGGEWVLLLNPDTAVGEGFLDQLEALCRTLDQEEGPNGTTACGSR